MSLLIQLRDRMRGIETIKKITHAMRLISMSSRSRLKTKEDPLKEYNNTVKNLFVRLYQLHPEWKNPLISNDNEQSNILVILVGSQRGLCGNFNTILFHF